ncbi:dihydrofolate reductase family protein [Nocardioides sp. InS609-2]|uniref:dihydrofolate reductase family protein n=1 Tax=Nocardioides sp. InS609-2 TaxID=2760705 RepID=UPI0020C1519D|nr:dihydrofolate reductase family protein [Nocardioides sp. InS609-2]
MRVLIGDDPGADVADDDLSARYARPFDHVGPWLRVNMVSTVDGAAQGEDGKSGGINNAADKRVFDALRRVADCVVVGAGTLRTEGYRPTAVPLVVVSRSARVPPLLQGAEPGRVLMATTERAPGLAEARALLGPENVMVLGTYSVDLVTLKAALYDRGFTEQLSEGGPQLLHHLLAEGVADELCVTVVPRAVAGSRLRIVVGSEIDVPLTPTLLLEEAGTLLGRWHVTR